MAEKDLWASWNGAVMPLSSVRVSPLDRAYLFGDAAYEVMRVYGGQPFMLAAHRERLRMSLEALKIPADLSSLNERLAALMARAGAAEAAIYLQVSRGEAPRSHLPPAGMRPNELVWIEPLPPD